MVKWLHSESEVRGSNLVAFMQCLFFKHSYWLIILNIQSECLKTIIYLNRIGSWIGFNVFMIRSCAVYSQIPVVNYFHLRVVFFC